MNHCINQLASYMKTVKIKDSYYKILKKSSDDLDITPEELLDYLITQELNYSILQHKMRKYRQSE